jgi:CheY-like chemotaxis protein
MMPRTLLVVDDEPDLVELMRLMLEGAGYRVVVAGDGREALRLLDQARCDLVMSDVLMPDVDGAGLAAAMHADPALHDIPLILMSAVHRAPAPMVPHDAFLRKPFDLEVLLATVARLLGPDAARV